MTPRGPQCVRDFRKASESVACGLGEGTPAKLFTRFGFSGSSQLRSEIRKVSPENRTSDGREDFSDKPRAGDKEAIQLFAAAPSKAYPHHPRVSTVPGPRAEVGRR
jgi:hypothetical protein